MICLAILPEVTGKTTYRLILVAKVVQIPRDHGDLVQDKEHENRDPHAEHLDGVLQRKQIHQINNGSFPNLPIFPGEKN